MLADASRVSFFPNRERFAFGFLTLCFGIVTTGLTSSSLALLTFSSSLNSSFTMVSVHDVAKT
jgi:hypothetical protein